MLLSRKFGEVVEMLPQSIGSKVKIGFGGYSIGSSHRLSTVGIDNVTPGPNFSILPNASLSAVKQYMCSSFVQFVATLYETWPSLTVMAGLISTSNSIWNEGLYAIQPLSSLMGLSLISMLIDLIRSLSAKISTSSPSKLYSKKLHVRGILLQRWWTCDSTYRQNGENEQMDSHF